MPRTPALDGAANDRDLGSFDLERFLPRMSYVRIHRSYMGPIDKISGYDGLFVQVNKNDFPIGGLYKQRLSEHEER